MPIFCKLTLLVCFYCWNLTHGRFFHNRSLIKDISFKIFSTSAHFRAPVSILGHKGGQKYLHNSKVMFSSDAIYFYRLKLCPWTYFLRNLIISYILNTSKWPNSNYSLKYEEIIRWWILILVIVLVGFFQI